MAELEVARGVVAMDVVHLARAGRHQVFLLLHILINFEVNIGHLRIIARRERDFVCWCSFGIDGIETTVDIDGPIPIVATLQRAIGIGLLTMKPQQCRAGIGCGS